MPYAFPGLFAIDPLNPANVATNAEITIFDHSDPFRNPIALTDAGGVAIANPMTTNDKGFIGAFWADTDYIGWHASDLVGYVQSFSGVKEQVAQAAAAANESKEAAELSRQAAEQAASLTGAPADSAVATLISSETETREAADRRYVVRGDDIVNVRDFGAKGDGVTDDTAAIQTALDRGGNIVFPAGTYLAGALAWTPGSRITGQGVAEISHLPTGGVVGNFPRAIITSPHQPVYKSPSATDRQVVAGVASDITIENMVFNGNGHHVYGTQLVAVDRAHFSNVQIINASGAMDLRAVRHSTFTDVVCRNIQEDGISVTDQNFAAAVKQDGLRGISEHLNFTRCLVIDSQTTNGEGTSSMNAFEMDDGISNVTFDHCKAINSRGCGFEIHVHTDEYDMADIRFINCEAIDCKPVPGNARQIGGFVVGQCPAGSYFGRITFENCVSIGSPNAYAHLAGAETGYLDDIKIIGGTWQSLEAPADRNVITSSCIYAGKFFTEMSISNATIRGAVNGYGIYTFATSGALNITDTSISECYAPLYVTHLGGSLNVRNVRVKPGAPKSAAGTVCCYIASPSVSLTDLALSVDQSKYTSSIIRLINPAKSRITGGSIENTGPAANNAVNYQNVVSAVISGVLVSGFTNGLFFSGTVGSVVSAGNNFKGCTAKYNSTPTGLVDSGNAV